MRNATRKLMSTVLTVIIALITLGTTSFAWITLTNTVTIAEFITHVTTSEGIEISVDGGSLYYSDVPIDAMIAALQKLGYDVNEDTDDDGIIDKIGDFRFNLVTSSDGKAFRYLDGSIAEGGYIEFDCIIRSRTETAIYLSPSTTVSSSGKNWRADQTFSTGKGTPVVTGDIVNFKAAHGARISVTGAIDYEEEITETEVRYNPIAYSTVVYELGESDDSEAVGVKFVSGNTYLGNKVIEAGAFEYYNLKHGNILNLPALNTVPSSFTNATLATIAPSILNLENRMMHVDGFIYGEVTIRIWIEGWDADSFNAILTDNLAIQISFTTIKPVEDINI